MDNSSAFLWHYIKKTQKPILELGCGYGSSYLLHAYCAKHNIPLYTIEHDFEWFSKFREMESERHVFIHANVEKDGWDSYIQNIPDLDWGVVFIDHGSWKSRIDVARFMMNKGDYLMIHDFDHLSTEYGFGTVRSENPDAPIEEREYDLSSECKYFRAVFPKTYWKNADGPPTLICSNRKDDLTLPLEGELENEFLSYVGYVDEV